ncbi:MAG: replicative DNA helicase [Bacteroidetes bacterium]|nr:replicative DNA helicase [Bacteroidota bacterium]MDE2671532.1 replicative DNA helicase [Bacteroidota bacterium]
MQYEASRPQGPVLVQNLKDYSGRVPPQALDIEQYVLGAMLIDSEAVNIASAILPPDSFYLPKHTRIYQAICELFEKGQPTDLITVSEQLKKSRHLDVVGGLPYLDELTERVATSANTEHHARILGQKALLRKLIETMSKRITEAYDPATDAFELLDQAETDLFSISESQVRRSAKNLTDIVRDTIQHLQNITEHDGKLTGITSGFSELDELTGGWQDSDLVIIAGRPSMGKCVDADTPILQSDGSLVRIADLYERQHARLLTLGADHRFSITTPSAYVDDGLKPVYRVTTRLGRTVSTTLTHPFLTPRGWQPLGELATGCSIAVPSELPVFGMKTVPDAHISQLVASILHPDRVMRPMADARGQLVKSRGLQKLPGWTFTLDHDCLKSFVDQLLAIKRSFRVSSRQLARQLAHLLLRFGILARVQHTAGDWTVTPMGTGRREEGKEQIVYDEITHIEARGLRPVFDLTIDDTHNFVASDVCVHNTAFALACARNAAMSSDRPVSCAIFSMEMSARQLAQRLLTSEARVNAQAARAGKLRQSEFDAVVRAANAFAHTRIFIDDTAGLGVLELRAKCRRLKSEHDIGLVLVDYLQLMQGRSKDNREQEIANISRSLKGLAKELDIPVIALSQLNRNAEDRKDKRPQLSDLRESGAIEQDADVVAFIYRASYYGIEFDKNKEPTEGVAEIIVGKHRNGPTGTVKLSFLKDYARFENLERYRRPEDEFITDSDEEQAPL